jgi:hypothetical protein
MMVRSKKSFRARGTGKSVGGRQNRRNHGGGDEKHAEDDATTDFIPFNGTSKPASHGEIVL